MATSSPAETSANCRSPVTGLTVQALAPTSAETTNTIARSSILRIVYRIVKPLKMLMGLLPGGKTLAAYYSRRRRARSLAPLGDMEGVFSHYFTVNKWKNAESVSGVGSTFENTQSIREALPGLLRRLEVRSILDAPCGDYNWFRFVDRPKGIRYTGGDIVKALVLSNQQKYADETTAFIALDIVHDALPRADLWLCRDCMPHLAEELIVRAIKSFLRSDIRYLLTSVHPDCEANTDILTGDFRLLNLERLPFSFPPPLARIDDSSKGLDRKYLGLWERDALRRALESNDAFS